MWIYSCIYTTPNDWLIDFQGYRFSIKQCCLEWFPFFFFVIVASNLINSKLHRLFFLRDGNILHQPTQGKKKKKNTEKTTGFDYFARVEVHFTFLFHVNQAMFLNCLF